MKNLKKQGKTGTVDVQKDGDKITIVLNQNLTAAIADEFRLQLKTLLAEGAKEITIDLTGAKLVDSVGIGVLIMVFNSLKKIGGKMQVVHVSKEIMDLFKNLRLETIFNVTSL